MLLTLSCGWRINETHNRNVRHGSPLHRRPDVVALMSKHTPGPWKAFGPAPNVDPDMTTTYDYALLCPPYDAYSNIIGEMIGRSSDTIFHDAEANANRIVKCVNALDGIENPVAIKDLIEAMQNLDPETHLGSQSLGAWLAYLGVK